MLARLLPSLLAIAAFLLAGAALQALLPRPLERSIAARAGYAYFLGISWVGLCSWSAGFLAGARLGPALFWGSVGLAVGGAVVVVALRGGHPGGLTWSPSPGLSLARRLGPLAVGLLVIPVTIALLADALVNPVHDFDGRMTWGTQARYLQAEQSVLPAILTDPRAFIIHPRYPILMPLVQVASTGLSGTDLGGFGVRPIYVLFLPALAAVLVSALRRHFGQVASALSTILVLSAPALLWDIDVGARGTYSDLPQGSFLGAGLLLLADPRTRHEPWRGAMAGLLLMAAVATKNEGMLLAPAVAVLAAANSLRRWARRRSWQALRGLGGPLVAAAFVGAGILLVIAWRVEIPNRNDESYFESLPAWGIVSGLVSRAPAIVGGILERSFDVTDWGAIFWLAPLLLIAGRGGSSKRIVRWALVLLAGQCVLAFSAYAVAPSLDIIDVTWSRLLLQVLVPMAIVLAAATRQILTASDWRSPYQSRGAVARIWRSRRSSSGT